MTAALSLEPSTPPPEPRRKRGRPKGSPNRQRLEITTPRGVPVTVSPRRLGCTSRQASAITGMTPATIRRLVAEGRLKATRLGHGVLLLNLAAVEALIPEE
jgi:excisionase family DNA binding protein